MGKRLNVLGICAGNGVCLYPFKLNPNFNLIGNVEPRSIFYTKCQKQWKSNFGNLPMVKLLEEIKCQKVDVIIGHPDCGDSSILRMSRSKSFGDVLSNRSLNIFIDSINLFTPSYFLLENLPGLLKNLSIEELSERFGGRYTLSKVVAPVSLFGNSQVSRVRLVIVGTLVNIPPCTFPKSYPHDPLNAEAFELGLEPLPELGHVREPLSKLCNLYHPDGRRQIAYWEAMERWVELGPSAKRWPVGGVMNNQPGVSRNIVGEPPLTVRKQNRQFGTQGYVLSPREMANIQGVPSCFKIFINQDQIVYWLNKSRASVTKTMPYEIGLWFMNTIIKLKYSNHGNQKGKSKPGL